MFNIKKVAQLKERVASLESHISVLTTQNKMLHSTTLELNQLLKELTENLQELTEKVIPPVLKVVSKEAVDLAYELRKNHKLETGNLEGGHKEFYRIPKTTIDNIILSAQDELKDGDK